MAIRPRKKIEKQESVIIVSTTIGRGEAYADSNGYPRSCVKSMPMMGRVYDKVITVGDLDVDTRYALAPLRAYGTVFEAGFDQF
jgi:hypothetical protein